MRRFRHFFGLKTAALFIALAGLSFIQIAPVTAAGRCFCYGAGNEKSGCGPQTEATCKKDDDSVRGYKFEACLIQTDNAACEKEFADWKARQDSAAAAKGVASQSKFIPDCALAEKLDLKGPCGDVSVFVVLLLNASNYLFTIIGAIALAVFVYGGVLMVISQGNSEKTKKGMETLMAAFIGLIVAFAGYMLINFLAGALGVVKEFRL